MIKLPTTKREEQVLALIESHIHKRGFSPTIKELSAQLKLAHASGAHRLIENLIKKGKLRRAKNRWRGLSVIKEPK